MNNDKNNTNTQQNSYEQLDCETTEHLESFLVTTLSLALVEFEQLDKHLTLLLILSEISLNFIGVFLISVATSS